MYSEDKFWLSVWIIIGIGIIVISISLTKMYHDKQITMAKLGYEQTKTVGSSTTIWVKGK